MHHMIKIKFVKNVLWKVETGRQYFVFCVAYEILFRLPAKRPGRF